MSIAWAAVASVLANRCPYTVRVKAGVPCPSRRLFVSTSRPAGDQRRCMRVPQRVEHDRRQRQRDDRPPPVATEIVRRAHGAVGHGEHKVTVAEAAHPQGQAKLALAEPVHPRGVDRRSWQGDQPATMPRLWRLHAQPGGFLHAALDADGRRVEIGVAPPQRAKLTAAHPGAKSQSDDRAQSVAVKPGEHLADLGAREGLDFVCLDLGRPEHGGGVTPDDLHFCSAGQDSMQNPAGVPNRPGRREGPAPIATGP